ncbi:MAG: energy-coupling factor transporter transmembrane component T [Syntrophomonas sp.]
MFSNLSLGQYISAPSLIHEIDPRSKIIATFMLTLAVFQAEFPVQQTSLLILLISLILLSKVNIKIYLLALKPFVWIILITMLILAGFTPGSSLMEVFHLSFTVEGLRAAASLGIRFIILLGLARLLTVTTSPMAMSDALESLLKPLQRLGLPVHELVMIMNISLRFIPLFFEEAERIRKAQLGRGANFQQGSLKQRLGKLRSIIVPVFRNSLERADELATAMESRGYQGGRGRTRMNELIMHPRDYLYASVMAMISIAVMLY